MTEHEENILLGFQNTAQSIGNLQVILFGKHCNIKREREDKKAVLTFSKHLYMSVNIKQNPYKIIRKQLNTIHITYLHTKKFKRKPCESICTIWLFPVS